MGYLITTEGIAKLEQGKVPLHVTNKLREEVGRYSTSSEALMEALSDAITDAQQRLYRNKIIAAFYNPYDLRTLNKMEIGAVHWVVPNFLLYRRVPGGWMAEYYADGVVTSCAFINTNWIIDRT